MACAVNRSVARHYAVWAEGVVSGGAGFVPLSRLSMADRICLASVQMLRSNLKTTWINCAPVDVTQANEDNTGEKFLQPDHSGACFEEQANPAAVIAIYDDRNDNY